jgi:hypothetical protein
MKVTAKSDRTHNPFDETYRVSGLRENLTSSSKGEGLETGLRSTLNGHAGGNPGDSQGQSYGVPRQSFTRQGAFHTLSQTLETEINTLGYPPAALLAFCVGRVSFNIFAVVKAALRSVHGEMVVEEQVSTYSLTNEIAGTYQGMRIALPAQEWTIFHELSTEEMANLLWEWAGFIRLSRYPKSKRGPKKTPPPREHDPKKPHVSTARLLASRRRRS